MLTEIQLEEIREHLEKAQNPLFFFDNDPDGLCSFLILQRYIGRGKGVALRGVPGLSRSSFRKVNELNPDYIFLLDRSHIDEDFLELANEANIPIVCIDHHDVPKPNIKAYYNTFDVSKKIEPTCYLSYKVTKRKEDLWLATIGSIADCFLPEDLLLEFKKQYPELIDKSYKTAFDIRFNTSLRKIIDILAYGLLDKTSNVVSMLKYLMKAKGPHDVLEETPRTKSFLSRYELINQKVQTIVQKAEKEIDKDKKLLFFTYGGDMSVSQQVSDELSYKYPDLVIVISFIKGNSAKFSLRGKVDVRQIVLNSIKNIEGAMGGGHEHSSGAQILADQVPEFKKNILEQLKD